MLVGGCDFPQKQADILDTLVDRRLREKALLQTGGKGERMRDDVGQHTERNPFFEKLDELMVKFLTTFEDLSEEADQLGSRRLLRLSGGDVFEDLYLGRAIELSGRHLTA